MKSISVREIAKFFNGEIVGDDSRSFALVSKIDQAIPGSLSFLANNKYEDHLYSSAAGIILVSRTMELKKETDATLVKVDDPYSAFCEILNKYFNTYSEKKGIEDKAYIDKSTICGKDVYLGSFSYVSANCKIGERVKIYPNSFIGEGTVIGADTVIYSGVKIYHDIKIGSQCIIHSGCVIGSDGFGHAPQRDGSYLKIPQLGNVVIGDHVEIGANTTIDRATLGSTVIGNGVKLDNLIQVAHNVEIGENTVIAALAGVSGSVKLGKNCVIGGQVGFVGHIAIADGTQIGAQSGISKNVDEPGKQWIGSPIMPLQDAFRTQVVYRKLPALKAKVEELEKQINELQRNGQ